MVLSLATRRPVMVLVVLMFLSVPRSIRAQAPEALADSTLMWWDPADDYVGFTVFSRATDFYTASQWPMTLGKRGTATYSRQDVQTGEVEILKLSDFNP